MRRSNGHRGVWLAAGWGLLLGALALVGGCELPGGARPAAALRDDIVAIQQYPPTDPWLRNDEGRITGIRTRVYFLPAAPQGKMPKGVFVSGTIKAALYALTLRPDGSHERQLAYEWSFDERGAAGYRIRSIRNPSVMGESYGLLLRWPSDLGLAGREIQIMLSYQRNDGETIARRGTRFQVPLPPGAQMPHAVTSMPARGLPDPARPKPDSRPPPKPGAR
jgi:hypothetical protein